MRTAITALIPLAAALTLPARPPLRARLTNAWRARADADPRFRQKLALEAALACALQTTAEVQRRGRAFGHEADYVVAGLLTALAGKLVAAFQAAPSAAGKAPTNAFQPDLPARARVGAVVGPMPRLFGVGFAAAAVGYGLTDGLTRLRDLCGVVVAAPPRVPILGAAVYTGLFVALVSNGSHQILQGLVERGWWGRRQVLLVVGRAGRSLLASALAIRGMQLSGLQAVTAAR
jgi:hypothetical protein